LKMAQDAAIGFCRRLRANDVAQVISFDSETRILQPFTADAAALETAIRISEQVHANLGKPR
jgi:hypothetical protein